MTAPAGRAHDDRCADLDDVDEVYRTALAASLGIVRAGTTGATAAIVLERIVRFGLEQAAGDGPLAEKAGQGAEIIASQRGIAARAGLDVGTVGKALKRLEDQGHIVRTAGKRAGDADLVTLCADSPHGATAPPGPQAQPSIPARELPSPWHGTGLPAVSYALFQLLHSTGPMTTPDLAAGVGRSARALVRHAPGGAVAQQRGLDGPLLRLERAGLVERTGEGGWVAVQLTAAVEADAAAEVSRYAGGGQRPFPAELWAATVRARFRLEQAGWRERMAQAAEVHRLRWILAHTETERVRRWAAAQLAVVGPHGPPAAARWTRPTAG